MEAEFQVNKRAALLMNIFYGWENKYFVSHLYIIKYL